MRPSCSTAIEPGRPSTIGTGDGDAPGLATGLATGEAERPGTINGRPGWPPGEALICTRVAIGWPTMGLPAGAGLAADDDAAPGCVVPAAAGAGDPAPAGPSDRDAPGVPDGASPGTDVISPQAAVVSAAPSTESSSRRRLTPGPRTGACCGSDTSHQRTVTGLILPFTRGRIIQVLGHSYTGIVRFE
jgi:hypothetical protein